MPSSMLNAVCVGGLLPPPASPSNGRPFTELLRTIRNQILPLRPAFPRLRVAASHIVLVPGGRIYDDVRPSGWSRASAE